MVFWMEWPYRTGVFNVIEQLELLDLLTIDPIIIRIGRGKNKLYIKYGSNKVNMMKVSGKYHLKENVKRILEGHRNKEVIKKASLSKIEQEDENLKSKNIWGINFQYPATCKYGYCISTDPYDFTCPKEVVEDCGFCDGSKFWNNNYRKMFPKFHIQLRVESPCSTKNPLILDVSTTTYNELKEDVKFIYDECYVYVPTIYGSSELKQFKVEPIGYSARTSFITLELNKMLFKALIEDVLSKNNDLLELLKFKCYIYESLKNSSSYEIPEKIVEYNKNSVDTDSKDFREFTYLSTIHTLAHMWLLFILSEINVEPDKLIYKIDGDRIILFENAKNDGMGIVETLRSQISTRGAEYLFNDFIEWCLKFIDDHNKFMSKAEKEVRSEAKETVANLESTCEDIRNLLEDIKELNLNLEKNLDLSFIDLGTYRMLLVKKLDYPEEYFEYFQPIVLSHNKPNLCYDGCEDCIVFYRGCTQPFTQKYLLSKNLLVEVLEKFKGRSHHVVGKDIGNILLELGEKSDRIFIKTPFIDDFGINVLNKWTKSGKKVSIIVRPSEKDKLKLENVNIKLLENFHSKIYIFLKNKQMILCEGSINLQEKGFFYNEENLSIIWDQNTCWSRLSEHFGDFLAQE